MLKKILLCLLGCFWILGAHAAQIVNVEYIHLLIKQEHDLEYAYQLKTLIVNNLLKIKINYV